MDDNYGTGIDFNINIACTLGRRMWIASCPQLGTVRTSSDRDQALRMIVADIEAFLAGVAVTAT